MKRLWKMFSGFNWLGFLMLCVCVVLGVGDVSGSVLSASGVATQLDGGDGGVQVQSGERGVLETLDYRQWAPNLIDDPVDQKVVQIRPYATPLDTLMRYFGTTKINNLEFKTYSISSRPLSDKVTEFTPVASADKGLCNGQLKVNNFNNFDVTDTIIVNTVAGGDDKPLLLYVYAKDDTNKTLSVAIDESQAVEVAGSDPVTYQIPAIAANTAIYAGGRASAETDVLTPAVEYLPKAQTGYCQIFKCQISMSNYAKMADKEIKWDLNEIEEEALYDFRRRQETSYINGHKGKIYDPVKKTYVYTTGGILNSFGNSHAVNSSNPDGNAELVELAKKVFVGNSGSTERFALAGSEAISKISKLQGIHKHQDAVKTEVIFGITWSKIVTNFGTINLAPEPVLNEIGHGNEMLVVDPQFLKKYQVLNFERQKIDGKEHAITNGDLVVFTETSGIAVLNPNAHCIVTVS